MKFEPIIPMICTERIQETVDFYVNHFKFVSVNISEEWGWAVLRKDQCEIMIAKPNEHISFEKPIFTGTFYIRVDDVDALWNELKETVKICYEIHNFDWGMREFAIYDNNGYMLQFGQDLTYNTKNE